MPHKSIEKFFEIARELEEKGVIRSSKYLGDIGEYICVQLYGIELNSSGRTKFYDGTLNNKKYEVKFHNAKEGRNIYLGNPNKYDYVLVVLGPNSRIRPDGIKGDFVIYKIKADYIKKTPPDRESYTRGKTFFQNLTHDKVYNYQPL